MNGVQSTDFSRVWMSPKAQLKLVLSTPLFLFRLCLSSRSLPLLFAFVMLRVEFD